MRDRLFIRIDRDFPEQVNWLRVSDDAGRRWAMSRGDLSDASREAVGCQLIVLVPGAEVLLTEAMIPSRQRQHIINAVPFALEDQLASDIDDMHFALGPRNDAGMVPVAVVSQQIMRDWLESLRDAGLEPDLMVPDMLALPLQDKGWSVLHDGAEVLVRQGPYAGAVIDTAAASAWFDLALAEQGDDRPEQIKLFDNQHNQDDRLVLQTDNIVVDAVESGEASLPFLARHFTSTPVINLIQGDYSPREQFGRLLRPWRLTAALLAVLIFLGTAKTMIDYYSLSVTSERLSAEINQIYRDTFPDAVRVVNARVQMESKLAELSAGGSAGDQGFLQLLGLIGEPMQKINGIELQHAAYQDGRLSLLLRIKDLQLLEQLKQGLLGNKNLNVDIQSAASRDDYVDARLLLWRQGS
jgi:general secretion pathway protein L